MMRILTLISMVAFSVISLNAKSLTMEMLKSNALDINVKISKSVKLPEVSLKVEKADINLEHEFTRLRNDLRDFSNRTTWLRFDIEDLTSRARRIAYNNAQDSFFVNDLRNMSYELSSYFNDVRRISREAEELSRISKKDENLNRIAKDILNETTSLLNRFQFDVENAARDLEYVVRNINTSLIGYNTYWIAYDISRYAGDITFQLRNVYNIAIRLDRNTRP